MAEGEWERTVENGFASDPRDVDKLFRVALAKIASGEATGAFILLCDQDGFVYMADELPRSRSCVAESILCLEAKASMIRESWEENSIVFCERPNPMQVAGGTGVAALEKKDDADPAT